MGCWHWKHLSQDLLGPIAYLYIPLPVRRLHLGIYSLPTQIIFSNRCLNLIRAIRDLADQVADTVVQNMNARGTIYSIWIMLRKCEGGCEARLVRSREQIW